MKLQLYTLVAALALGVLANPVAEPIEGEAEAEGHELVARQCQNVGCNCVGARTALYCGYCPEVRGNWVSENVYQCNSNGACCSFGRRTSCANGQGPCGG